MKLLFLLLLVLSLNAFADEFAELKSKQTKKILEDPFANNKAVCLATTESGDRLKETWKFFNLVPKIFFRDLGNVGITQKGTYTVDKDVLHLQETDYFSGNTKRPSDKKWDYKYKLKPSGFEYIHQSNGHKTLYECAWSGSSSK